MEVSYNLRYQKSGFSGRSLLNKEGEVIVYEKGFRLKGKGAGDKGEMINFSELKEFYGKNDKVVFINFLKEKYVLSDLGNLFDQFLLDIYKARNEFLMDALFMKAGRLKAEFEGFFARSSKFGKMINKGRAKLKLYEKSLVVVPKDQDAFAVHFNFVNYHEFDEDEYLLKIVCDDGSSLNISQLGNDFEFFEEKMNELLGGMYEFLVNKILKDAFPTFHTSTLLKLAYAMRCGKAVSEKDLHKIDKELPEAMAEFFPERKNLTYLNSLAGNEGTFMALAPDPAVAGNFVRWLMWAIPMQNLVAFCILPRWQEKDPKTEILFYKIIMENGDPELKLQDKMMEINQSLLVLNFAKDPAHKDKRELKYSPYQYAIRKLPFLRILRKSFVGKVNANDVCDSPQKLEVIFKGAGATK